MSHGIPIDKIVICINDTNTSSTSGRMEFITNGNNYHAISEEGEYYHIMGKRADGKDTYRSYRKYRFIDHPFLKTLNET